MLEQLFRRAREGALEDEPLVVVMEPTGMAWFPVAVFCQRRGVKVYLVNSQQVADLRRYYRKHAKSDRMDARVLAKLQSIPLDGLIVAEMEGQYDGFLYWFVGEKPWFEPGVDRYAHITEVQVLERCQGQGVGRKLLAYALEHLKQNAVEAVYIDTTEDNMAAQHLYESAGFRPFSRTLHYKYTQIGDEKT